jgi:hypothetical protein
MNLSTKVGFLICGVSALMSADTLTLRSGEVVQGTYLGGSAREIRMDLNGAIRTYDIGQIQSVTFSDPAPAYQAPPPPPPQASNYPPRQPYNAPAPGPLGITIPVDSPVTVRMIESVNSDSARLGQTFRASLDDPIYVNGQVVVPRGADVLTRLVEDQQSGKIEGRTVLKLALQTITINGTPVPVTSSDVQQESSSRGARSAKVIGGTAALGALIGGLAGGGKGAAIGAGSGAAVGTGAEVLTSGQKVKIPSETRLTFRLQNPVQL